MTAKSPRTSRWALPAGVLGLVATAVGLAVCVPRIVVGNAHAADYAGVILAVGGIALIVLAFRLAFLGRSRRFKLLALPVTLVLLQWYAIPVMQAGLITNSPRDELPAAATLGLAGARDVSFEARDGVRLAGWYVPGRNHAAVVLMHGSHGDRADTRGQLRMLARAGYAVLAFDARGHGESGGRTNALGWQGAADVAGAVSFLRSQPGVDRGRIAALGLSMGAEEALRAASQHVPLSAVIADGAGASTAGDERIVGAAALPASVNWVTMRAVEIFSRQSEPPPLGDVVARVQVPVLLIASNRKSELTLNRAYQSRIGAHAQLWYVADAGHTQALERHPVEYAARIQAFLGRTQQHPG